MRSRDQKKLKIRYWPAANEDDVKFFEEAADTHRQLWLSEWNKTRQHKLPDSRGGSYRAERNKAARLQMLSQTQKYLGLRANQYQEGKHVVFICVDIEAMELPPNPVSEVGIAVLDTQLLKDVAASPVAANWWKFIQAHHLRIQEYAGQVNYRFIQGCPDNFDFGFVRTFLSEPYLVALVY
jgi:hypothetical protein